jgi:hypothetical protein
MNRQQILLKRGVSYLAVLGLALASILPLLSSQLAGAAQINTRSLTISTSQISATADYAFEFDVATTSNLASIQVEFCETPLGTCDAPSGLSTNGAALVDSTIAGGATSSFVLDSATGNVLQINTATAESTTADDTVVLEFSGIVNPDVAMTFYPRITTYVNDDYTGLVDNGVVAAATVEQILVTARVQERLVFCVGTVRDTGGAADDVDVSECDDISGTTKDLGAVDFLDVCTTLNNPCEHNNPTGGDGASYALIATNAQEGAIVTYYAEEDQTPGATGELGSLRIPGADNCTDPASTTDQCFNSAGTTATTITAGTEMFGMTVGGINQLGLTTNLAPAADYNGNGQAEGTCAAPGGNCWAWDPSGTVRTIASSNDVLDNEVLLIHFAATASLTTPTGQYAVTSTYVATPTF